jgi:hypothetical protein
MVYVKKLEGGLGGLSLLLPLSSPSLLKICRGACAPLPGRPTTSSAVVPDLLEGSCWHDDPCHELWSQASMLLSSSSPAAKPEADDAGTTMLGASGSLRLSPD